MAILVRFIGLFLLLFGLWIAIQVMLEALELYRKPESIERFARAIERGSNIDKSLLSLKQSITEENPDMESIDVDEFGKDTGRFTNSSDIRISYFFAWVIVLLLLLLIARIAIAAIKTGGELVLYDLQVKHLAKALVKETSRPNH